MYIVKERNKHFQKESQEDSTFNADYNEELRLIWRKHIENLGSKVFCEKAGLQPLWSKSEEEKEGQR